MSIDFTEALVDLPPASRYVVAFSGGLDSTVLLHLLAQSFRTKILAVHINHQLQSQASAWQTHCASVCRQWQIPFQAISVTINTQGRGLEAAARERRYQALSAVLQPDDVLFMAHHADDQVETLLQRLFRGSGLDGLQAIPQQRFLGNGLLFRPLLSISKAELQAYAQQHHLIWIEDPSNQNTDFERNYIRNSLLPSLEKRWQGLRHSLLRVVSNLQEVDAVLSDYLAQDLQRALTEDESALSIEILRGFSAAKQRLVLRYWLQQRGIPLPERRQLMEIQQTVLHSSVDATPCVHWGQFDCRRFQQRLYVFETLPTHNSALTLDWPEQQALTILDLSLELSAALRQQLACRGNCQIRFRQSGERVKKADGHHQSLKHWFQEQKIPPWQRDRLPLVYCGDTLTAIIISQRLHVFAKP